jgi:hypothetical protein
MKYITLILMLLSLALLAADPVIYPTTTLVENFGATWCGACEFALDGLDVLAADVPPAEIIVSRLLTESGEYTTPEIDDRFAYYEVLGLPAVIFNGKVRVDGSGDGIADGSLYHAALNNYRYLGSPLKMLMPSFDPASGTISVSVELLNPAMSIQNASLFFYLVEDNISTELTNVLRDIVVQDLDLSYTGDAEVFNASFDIDPSWITGHLRALAFVQLENKSVLQSVSSIALPPHFVQAALPFDNNIQGEANVQYESPHFLIYNLGAADTFTRHIEVLSAPDDWYFNYCDADGNCYPGSIQIPFELGTGESIAYDLNLAIGSDGTGIFNFVISSDALGEYKIPFVYSTGTSNSDLVSAPDTSVLRSYPNPFSSQLTIEINSPKAGNAGSLELFNLKGQKLQSISLNSLNQGINSLELDTADLPNGVYFYKLSGSARTGKILKIK